MPCLLLAILLIIAGWLAAYVLHATIVMAAILALLIAGTGVFWMRRRRKTTPQEWSRQLEKHLLGTEGPYDWKNATSHKLADKRLENLRLRLVRDFESLETSEKMDQFRRIVDALKRGEIPE